MRKLKIVCNDTATCTELYRACKERSIGRPSRHPVQATRPFFFIDGTSITSHVWLSAIREYTYTEVHIDELLERHRPPVREDSEQFAGIPDEMPGVREDVAVRESRDGHVYMSSSNMQPASGASDPQSAVQDACRLYIAAYEESLRRASRGRTQQTSDGTESNWNSS